MVSISITIRRLIKIKHYNVVDQHPRTQHSPRRRDFAGDTAVAGDAAGLLQKGVEGKDFRTLRVSAGLGRPAPASLPILPPG